jgi:hypothetical protein
MMEEIGENIKSQWRRPYIAYGWRIGRNLAN